MATPNLALDLPVVSGDSDTWGTKLNTAFTALDTWAGGSASPLLKSGGTLTGALVVAVGTVGAPGLSFAGDTDCGLYRIGANNIGIAVNGAKVLDVATTGLGVTGALTVSGAVSSGAITSSGTVIATALTASPGAGNAAVIAAATSGAADATVGLQAAAGRTRYVSFASGVNTRWQIGANGTSEAGSNAGSDFVLNAFTDAGSALATWLTVTRSSGLVTLGGALTVTGAITGNLTGNVTGNINGTVGGVTPAAGSFTTVTASGLVSTPATAVGGAGLRVPHGTAPSSPVNGDIWTTSSGLFARINGITQGPYAAAAGGVLLAANNLSDLGSASSARTNLGLGTSATVNTGTSGAVVPLLNGNNTHGGTNTFSGLVTISAGADVTPAAAPSTTAVGYLGSPINPQTGNYTCVMADAGKTISYTGSGGHTITLPAEASVNYPVGTVINFINGGSGSITIALTTDTLRWINTTGSRTLAQGGSASAIKVSTAAGAWRITGDVLS